jgi:hypothetical protein
MAGGITLTLSRNSRALWLEQEGNEIEILYEVTGVGRLSDASVFPVRVLNNGKTIAIIWNVIAITEKW